MSKIARCLRDFPVGDGRYIPQGSEGKYNSIDLDYEFADTTGKHTLYLQEWIINPHFFEIVEVEEVAVAWKPTVGEAFWYFDVAMRPTMFAMRPTMFGGDDTSFYKLRLRFLNCLLECGNYFRTREDCQHAADSIRDLLIKAKTKPVNFAPGSPAATASFQAPLTNTYVTDAVKRFEEQLDN